jgi:plasmid stabilization system protein ParE
LSYTIKIAPHAAAAIRAGSDWWLKNRSKAPEAFADEIERGFELIRSLPGSGEPVAHSEISKVRRLLLGRIRYHLYYRVDRETETIEVLAFWHASRGSQPTL